MNKSMNSPLKNTHKDKLFKGFGIFTTLAAIGVLGVFLVFLLYMGLDRLSWEFITGLPSRFPKQTGIYTAIVGTIYIMILVTIFALPVGIGAGIYLEEYGTGSKLDTFLEINISNLAGVPSVIYGLLGLEVFVYFAGWGNSLLAGALTLSLLILPIIIVSTREAVSAVPSSIKEASVAMGASKWQTIWHQTLPASIGGIITGVILAVSRAIGETAPLIVIGALAYVPFVPQSIFDKFTVVPIQIYNYVTRPQHGFVVAAAAAIIVLLFLTFLMNGIAVYLRNRWQKKMDF